MATHHNISGDTLPHIHEKRSLSGAYGKRTRIKAMKVVKKRKEAVEWCLGIQDGVIYPDHLNPCYPIRELIRSKGMTWRQLGYTPKEFDHIQRKYDPIVCKNRLQELREGEYDATRSFPDTAILYFTQTGKVTWEELGSNKEEILLLGAQKILSDIRNRKHANKNFPEHWILRYIEDEKITWDELQIGESEFYMLIAGQWLADLEEGEHDAAIYFPGERLLEYIKKGKVTPEVLETTEKKLHLLIAQKWFSDIEKGIKDDTRYAPLQNFVTSIGQGKVTLAIGETESV